MKLKNIRLSPETQNMAKKKVENILIVSKTTRFDRLAGLNRVVVKKSSDNDDCQNNILDQFYSACSETLEKIKDQHQRISDNFYEMMVKSGKYNVKMISEIDILPQHTHD